eukprot:921126-Prymnesium_polylepis.1
MAATSFRYPAVSYQICCERLRNMHADMPRTSEHVYSCFASPLDAVHALQNLLICKNAAIASAAGER